MLTDRECKAAAPESKDGKLFDGEGLFLLVTKAGFKGWRLKYRFGGKEKQLTFGPYRGAGMSGELQMDMGMEAMEMSFICGGPMRDVLRQFGVTTVDGVYLRFAGNYQSDDTASHDHVEVVVRGRHAEIDMGDQESGSPSEFKVKTAVAYYKLTWNGRTEIEIDPLNMIEIIDGVDRLAARRASLGIFLGCFLKSHLALCQVTTVTYPQRPPS